MRRKYAGCNGRQIRNEGKVYQAEGEVDPELKKPLSGYERRKKLIYVEKLRSDRS